MGEWFTYKLKLVDKNKNLEKMLKDAGAVMYEDGKETPRIRLNVVDPNASHFSFSDTGDTWPVSFKEEKGYLIYWNKWTFDDRLAYALSEYFPEEVFYVSSIYSASGSMDRNWYIKNGQAVTKDGKPFYKALTNVNEKLIKERANDYQISLPIGQESDKWGRIYVPKENVAFAETDTGIIYSHCVLLDSDVTVYFRNSTAKLTPEELSEKYYEAKDAYYEKMHRFVKISGIAIDNFEKKTSSSGDYYVVKIPCPYDVSPNGVVSVAVPEYDTDLEAGAISLGECFRERNVIIVDDYDHKIRKSMTHGEIEDAYKKACVMNRVDSGVLYNSESTHDTVSEDLDLEERDL